MKQFSQPGPATWAVAIVVTCLVLFAFQKIIWLLVPGLLALMLYYCIRPVVERIVRRGLSQNAAVNLVMGTFFLITLVLVVRAGLGVAARIAEWQSGTARYVEAGQNLMRRTITSIEQRIPALQRAPLGAPFERPIDESAGELAMKHLGPIAIGVLEWTPSLLLVPYLTYFMLKDGSRLKKYLVRGVPNAFFEKTLLLFERLDESLQNYFQGLLRLMLLDTISLAAGLWILGISHPFLLGWGCAMLALIPYVGSIVGCIVVVLVAAADYPDRAGMAYGCLGLFLAVRLLDDFVYMPLTVGRKMHLHPVLGVLMLFLGAAVAGATGLVLALPVLGTVAVVGEVIAQIVTDKRLRARYRQAKGLAVTISAAALRRTG
jgi:predicted PurR-regulated permease PerM